MSREGKKLRLWSQDDMYRALEDCRERGVAIATSARDHGVPRMTLADRLKGRVADNCMHGGKTALDPEHELVLCKYIEYMALRGFPLTVNQVIMYAWCIDKTKGKKVFGEKGPCYGWWLKFKSRHPDAVRLRRPDSLDRGRVLYSTVDNIKSYFQLLLKVLEDGQFPSRPQDIYNCDETMIDLNKSSRKVVVPRRMKNAHSRQVASSEHISIHCCVSAAGSMMPPFIIFKESFPGGNYARDGPDGALYGKQASGFMDSELFLKWFKNMFLKHARPTPERSVLLLLDGHISHCSPEVIEYANGNNVTLLALAPHTTHLCQPLDVAVYKSFKSHLDKLIKLGQCFRGDLWIAKKDVPRIVKGPLESSMSIPSIKSGFRKCGIHPYNPNAIDKTRLMMNKLIPDLDVDLSIPPTASGPNTVTVSTQTEDMDIVDNEGFASINVAENTPRSTLEEPTSSTMTIGTQTEPSTTSEIEAIPGASGISIKSPLTLKIRNPLVTTKIIPEELADIFFPPDEEIPLRRKRPLRVQSKARIMTSDDILEDIKEQKIRLENKGKGKAKGLKKKTSAKEKNGLDDNNCYICSKYWDHDSETNKPLWVGCEKCTHWCCPECLGHGFDYVDDYYCMDCLQGSDSE